MRDANHRGLGRANFIDGRAGKSGVPILVNHDDGQDFGGYLATTDDINCRSAA